MTTTTTTNPNNYIKRLERENAEKAEQLREVQEMVTEFMAHLETPKFHTDTTIQVGDVFDRLREIRMAAIVRYEG